MGQPGAYAAEASIFRPVSNFWRGVGAKKASTASSQAMAYIEKAINNRQAGDGGLSGIIGKAFETCPGLAIENPRFFNELSALMSAPVVPVEEAIYPLIFTNIPTSG